MECCQLSWMFCPFLHLEVKYIAEIWHQTFQSPVSFLILKKSNSITCKNVWIHPRQWKRSTSTTRHTARGCLSSLWHMVSIGFLLSLTDWQADARSVFFILRVGAGALTSTAEHRKTWSSQQDVINVTSSVGTRGSSTVHIDSRRKEKGKVWNRTRKKSAAKASLTLQVPLEVSWLACFQNIDCI